jgi:hypothetical protein
MLGMGDDFTLIPAHPQGEGQHQLLRAALDEAVSVADAALGPVRLSSPNAPATRDVLGTLFWGVLCGQWRYAHLSAVRFDPVNPPLLGMSKVVSEDSARRFLAAMDAEAAGQWLRGELLACYGALLCEPWVLDTDTTIKPIYGHQDGAKKGYNPSKPGRPSLAYHSYFIARLRGCLEVEEESGEHAPAKYGEEGFLCQCEERGQRYLFKLRQSPMVKTLIKKMERTAGWVDAGQGFEGIESRLQLKAWNVKLTKKPRKPKPDKAGRGVLSGSSRRLRSS